MPIDGHFDLDLQKSWTHKFFEGIIDGHFDLDLHKNWTHKFFEGINQKSAMISMCKIHIHMILNVSDKFIEKCRRSRLFSELHFCKTAF